MKKIKMLILCALCFSLVACTTSYERDTRAGEVVQITYEEFKDKVKNDKEPFMVITSQTNCGHCQTYLASLQKYLKNHRVTVYDLNLATQSENVYVMFEKIEQDVKELSDEDLPPFKGTPYTAIIENGKIVEAYSGPFVYEDGDFYSMDDFDSIVMDYRLDEKH